MTVESPAADLLLPEGTRLLHIGPHKTGTTALQGALRQARGAMADHGVVYAGEGRQHWNAALAVTGAKGMRGDPPKPMGHWTRLVDAVGAAGHQRVVISSEVFCEANAETARMIVDQLGGERVHVLVTLRPLSKIMPSAWQQYVRNGLRASYDEWLDGMLNKPPYDKPTATFWKRHRHDVLVERWASIVGAARLTVVVIDESDRSMLMRTFEQLVGLPSGLLVPEEGWTNRSLRHGEVELVRDINKEFRRRTWPDERYRVFIRKGMTQRLLEAHQPGPHDPQIETPAWALDRAADIAAEAVEKITAIGVRIIGDSRTLSGKPAPSWQPAHAAEPVLRIPAVTAAIMGTIEAGIARLPPPLGTADVPVVEGSGKPLEAASTGELLKAVARRALGRSPRRTRRPPDSR